MEKKKKQKNTRTNMQHTKFQNKDILKIGKTVKAPTFQINSQIRAYFGKSFKIKALNKRVESSNSKSTIYTAL